MDRRNTLQKEIIHRTLCEMCSHPTAAAVYEEVHRLHPTISRSTVYRVLGQMAEEGQILRLGLAGSDDRYDGNIHRHGHVRCRLCGAVADIPPGRNRYPRRKASEKRRNNSKKFVMM